jgi:hypothetical protein
MSKYLRIDFVCLLPVSYTAAYAAAQAVSRRLPTALARVRSRVKSRVGFLVDKAALGQVSSDYLGFLATNLLHQLLHKLIIIIISSIIIIIIIIVIIIQGWYNSPMIGPSNSGLGSTRAQEKGLYCWTSVSDLRIN